jgi:hypothetical protein
MHDYFYHHSNIAGEVVSSRFKSKILLVAKIKGVSANSVLTYPKNQVKRNEHICTTPFSIAFGLNSTNQTSVLTALVR